MGLSAFLFLQFASLSHAHDDTHDTSEPVACAVCIVSSSNDGDIDLPSPEPVEPNEPTLADYAFLPLTETQPRFRLEQEEAPDPPDIRPSAPRAPPHE